MKPIVILIVLAAIVVAGCAGSQGPGPNTVTMKGVKFNPDSIVIKAGETVTWVNEDPVEHQVKVGNDMSPRLRQGQSWSKTFNVPGEFDITCTIHPQMLGRVKVTT